jgi:hypothetical protein
VRPDPHAARRAPETTATKRALVRLIKAW